MDNTYPVALPDVPACQIFRAKGMRKSGMLRKKAGGIKIPLFQDKYDDRFIIINNGWVYYYKNEKSDKQQGKFSLQGYSSNVVNAEEEEGKMRHVFKVYGKNHSDRIWYFATDNELEKNEWMEAFRCEIEKYNFSKSNTMQGSLSYPLRNPIDRHVIDPTRPNSCKEDGRVSNFSNRDNFACGAESHKTVDSGIGGDVYEPVDVKDPSECGSFESCSSDEYLPPLPPSAAWPVVPTSSVSRDPRPPSLKNSMVWASMSPRGVPNLPSSFPNSLHSDPMSPRRVPALPCFVPDSVPPDPMSPRGIPALPSSFPNSPHSDPMSPRGVPALPSFPSSVPSHPLSPPSSSGNTVSPRKSHLFNSGPPQLPTYPMSNAPRPSFAMQRNVLDTGPPSLDPMHPDPAPGPPIPRRDPVGKADVDHRPRSELFIGRPMPSHERRLSQGRFDSPPPVPTTKPVDFNLEQRQPHKSTPPQTPNSMRYPPRTQPGFSYLSKHGSSPHLYPALPSCGTDTNPRPVSPKPSCPAKVWSNSEVFEPPSNMSRPNPVAELQKVLTIGIGRSRVPGSPPQDALSQRPPPWQAVSGSHPRLPSPDSPVHSTHDLPSRRPPSPPPFVGRSDAHQRGHAPHMAFHSPQKMKVFGQPPYPGLKPPMPSPKLPPSINSTQHHQQWSGSETHYNDTSDGDLEEQTEYCNMDEAPSPGSKHGFSRQGFDGVVSAFRNLNIPDKELPPRSPNVSSPAPTPFSNLQNFPALPPCTSVPQFRDQPFDKPTKDPSPVHPPFPGHANFNTPPGMRWDDRNAVQIQGSKTAATKSPPPNPPPKPAIAAKPAPPRKPNYITNMGKTRPDPPANSSNGSNNEDVFANRRAFFEKK